MPPSPTNQGVMRTLPVGQCSVGGNKLNRVSVSTFDISVRWELVGFKCANNYIKKNGTNNKQVRPYAAHRLVLQTEEAGRN